MVGSSAAQEYPTLTGTFQTRIQNDYTYKSKDKSQELNDTFTKTELGVELGLTQEFSIRSVLKLEPVKVPDGDRFFGDHGLWLDQLYVNFETDDFSLFAGKFHPKFSFGYDKAPYIYGRDFVEDYEMTEKIGVGGSIKVAPEGWGEHALTGAVYFQDATALSNSAFSRPRFDDPRTDRPGRLRKRNGGVSNTGSLESFVISLDGEKMPFLEGLEYTVGYRQQKRGVTESFDEKGFTAGVSYEIEITEELKVTPMVEYANFTKFEGADTSARYITGGILAEYGPWSLGTSYTSRRLKLREEGITDNDRLFQVSLGYKFDFGLGVYVGWKTQKVAGITSESVGLMALYGFEF
ncbi:MAG: DUF481 domain-containing protein [Alphaproteobacteria bacterium]|nr:DUF481 domain-containing protein [Alphaproteobacteria bacterium]